MSTLVASTSASKTLSGKPRPLRRLTFELFAIIVLKIALLSLIWWVAFAPHPKPDVSPNAIAHRLSPTTQTSPAGHP